MPCYFAHVCAGAGRPARIVFSCQIQQRQYTAKRAERVNNYLCVRAAAHTCDRAAAHTCAQA